MLALRLDSQQEVVLEHPPGEAFEVECGMQAPLGFEVDLQLGVPAAIQTHQREFIDVLAALGGGGGALLGLVEQSAIVASGCCRA